MTMGAWSAGVWGGSDDAETGNKKRQVSDVALGTGAGQEAEIVINKRPALSNRETQGHQQQTESQSQRIMAKFPSYIALPAMAILGGYTVGDHHHAGRELSEVVADEGMLAQISSLLCKVSNHMNAGVAVLYSPEVLDPSSYFVAAAMIVLVLLDLAIDLQRFPTVEKWTAVLIRQGAVRCFFMLRVARGGYQIFGPTSWLYFYITGCLTASHISFSRPPYLGVLVTICTCYACWPHELVPTTIFIARMAWAVLRQVRNQGGAVGQSEGGAGASQLGAECGLSSGPAAAARLSPLVADGDGKTHFCAKCTRTFVPNVQYIYCVCMAILYICADISPPPLREPVLTRMGCRRHHPPCQIHTVDTWRNVQGGRGVYRHLSL